MPDLRVLAGVLLGLILAAALAPTPGSRGPEAPPDGSALLSDVDGALDAVVVHYVPGAAPVVEVALRETLQTLPRGVTVHVVCPDLAAFRDLVDRVGRVRCVLHAVPVGHEMTGWSRDRWLALRAPGGGTVLVAPAQEDGMSAWPARAGDAETAFDLAAALGPHVRAWRAPIRFDGGDVVADGETVFVTARVLARNLGSTVSSADELRETLEGWFGRRVVLLPDAPDHHLGMLLALAGGRRALVGDPALGLRLLEAAGTAPPLEVDATPALQARFDAVARTVEEAGYRVVRVPVLPGAGSRDWITGLNVLLAEDAWGSVVWMPTFEGAAPIVEATEAAWRALGYRVRPVDCSATHAEGGSLRCLVNVLARRSAVPAPDLTPGR